MESCGIAGQIQVSNTTADLLKAAGKGGWLKERKDMVEAKGKGILKTFWLHPRANGEKSSATSGSSEGHQAPGPQTEEMIESEKDRRIEIKDIK